MAAAVDAARATSGSNVVAGAGAWAAMARPGATAVSAWGEAGQGVAATSEAGLWGGAGGAAGVVGAGTGAAGPRTGKGPFAREETGSGDTESTAGGVV